MKYAGWVVAGAFLVMGCGVKNEVYQRDVNSLKDQIAEVEGFKAQCLTDKKRLLDELALLGKEKGALGADLKKALDKVEELRIQAEKRKAKLRELKDKLQAMQAAGKLQVVTSKGRMIVKLPEGVLFDVGKSKLKPEGQAVVAQLSPILASLEGRHFQVVGHTDDTGTDETNWKLSANRGLEVAMYMITQGFPPERLAAGGYGKFQPVADNTTDEGRAQNRRIEIVLVPNIEELMGFGDE
ncbi:MAG: OmpA family protein [Deltaproteobacteria bacterium]|nr:OmpA family protein [Deltaproteobacteria bacterium]